MKTQRIITKKKCPKCSSILAKSEFPKNKNKFHGIGSYCKGCAKLSILNFYRSKNGLIKTIFISQKSSNLKRGYGKIGYSFEWFKNWLLKNSEFNKLFDAWVDSDFKKYLKPSVNRINDYIGYEKKNIELMTWKENWEKSCKDKIIGLNNKQSRPVFQMNLETNEIIKKHYSINSASRITGACAKNIKYCCDKKQRYKSSMGFKWAWA